MPRSTDSRPSRPHGEAPRVLLAAGSAARIGRRWLPMAKALAARGLQCTVAAPHLSGTPGDVRSIPLPGGADTRPGALAAAMALAARWQTDAPDVLVVDGHRLARAVAEVARLFPVPVVLAVVPASGREGSTLGRLLAHAAPLESRVDHVIPYGASGPLPLGAGVDPTVVNAEAPLLADRMTAERQVLAGKGRMLVSVLGSKAAADRFEKELLRREGRVSVRRPDPDSPSADLHVAIGASQVLVGLEDDGDTLDFALMAAALRIPVVARKGGATARVVDQAGFGLVAAEGPDLVRAVRELLADPMLRRRLGAAGRLLAERDGAVTTTSDALLALADRVVRRKFGEPVHLTGGGEIRAESELRSPERSGRRDLLGGGGKR